MRFSRLMLLAIAIPLCLGSTPESAEAKQPKYWKANVAIKNPKDVHVDVLLDGTPAFFFVVTIPPGGKTKFTGLLEDINYTVNYDTNQDGTIDESFNAMTVRGTTTFLVYP